MSASIFTIFFDKNNIYNYATFTCHPSQLHYKLLEEGFYGEESDMSEFDWIIFENGVMIKG